MSRLENPFKAGVYNGMQTYTLGADDRVAKVRAFTLEQCEAALCVPHLQVTVKRAVQARMRKLQGGAK